MNTFLFLILFLHHLLIVILIRQLFITFSHFFILLGQRLPHHQLWTLYHGGIIRNAKRIGKERKQGKEPKIKREQNLANTNNLLNLCININHNDVKI